MIFFKKKVINLEERCKISNFLMKIFKKLKSRTLGRWEPSDAYVTRINIENSLGNYSEFIITKLSNQVHLNQNKVILKINMHNKLVL